MGETIEVRYKYRLRVNTRRAALLDQTWASCRFVWNTSLGRWNDLWRYEQTSYTEAANHRELTDWRSRFDWLADVKITPQQQTLIDLHRSIRAFCDPKHPARRPRFKKRGTVNSARWTSRGFSVTGTGLGQRGDRLSIALPGSREHIPVVWSRPLPSPPKSVTVFRCAEGHYWASFVVRIETEHVDTPAANTGVDVGLNTLAATSDDSNDVANPRFSRREQKLLRRHDQRQGRGRWDQRISKRTAQRRARAHGRVKRRRLDYHHKTARRIARSYTEIGVEDLRIKNMLANHNLARAISDAGWGQWIACLEHQRRKIGRTIEYRDPRNTTQTCSNCGAKAKHHVGLGQRTFHCDACGMVLNRDRNAARNLEPGRTQPGRVLTTEDLEPYGEPGSASPRIPRL